ncbi:hypothetical protein CEXT_747601 [Caerostris extrusa]|uniref:Uncharacterized protein n=1 Tax=Caerostris extrusa TaxID=172846 RepID=A0AAV4T654_CAEEX|nr:hypothetical protein CEXT_747601 [Caerostris extrusa]
MSVWKASVLQCGPPDHTINKCRTIPRCRFTCRMSTGSPKSTHGLPLDVKPMGHFETDLFVFRLQTVWVEIPFGMKTL